MRFLVNMGKFLEFFFKKYVFLILLCFVIMIYLYLILVEIIFVIYNLILNLYDVKVNGIFYY